MAQPMQVKLEGVRQLTRSIAAVSPALRKELGEKNKDIGQDIIDRAFPKPERVGEGKGARPRPSANANVLQIMAGGAHRASHTPYAQWGAQWAPRNGERPYIVRSGEDNMDRIEDAYLDALASVAAKAGLRFKKR